MEGVMQTPDPKVLNDVYSRYKLSFSEIPEVSVPSAHSVEMELVCAKESYAAYAVYPDLPGDPMHDRVPVANSALFVPGALDVAGFLDAAAGDWESPRGYREIKTDRAGALVIWKDNHVIVAFRGTANWQDWIHNGNSKKISPPIGEIGEYGSLVLHMGFYGLTENIFPAILQAIIYRATAIQSNLSHRSPLVLTLCGHSLGGALALCFAAKLRKQKLEPGTIPGPVLGATYTFGAPRIGRGSVWRFIERPHYRLIVSGDPIPRFPPGFDEDYEATYLGRPTQPVSQPKSVLKKIWRAAESTILSRVDVKCHDMEIYIASITQKLAATRPNILSTNAPPQSPAKTDLTTKHQEYLKKLSALRPRLPRR